MHVKWKEKYEKEKENAIQHLFIHVNVTKNIIA